MNKIANLNRNDNIRPLKNRRLRRKEEGILLKKQYNNNKVLPLSSHTNKQIINNNNGIIDLDWNSTQRDNNNIKNK